MTLSAMSQPELLEIAEEFGTEATQDLNEAQIITRLMEDGITQEMVDTFLGGKQAAIDAADAAKVVEETKTVTTKKTSRGAKTKQAVEEEVVLAPDQQLLVMDRENGTYRVRGYNFTREHPFVLVGAEDAEYITENIEGFRYATPREAREYYS